MLGSTIQREIATMILRDLNDPRLPATLMPSVTRVKVSNDLSIADVFVTVMGTPGQQNAALNALKHSAGLMRTKLTKALTLRVAPYIKFHLDEQLRKELDLLNVLQKVHQENEEIDRQRGATDQPPTSNDDDSNSDDSNSDDDQPATNEE